MRSRYSHTLCSMRPVCLFTDHLQANIANITANPNDIPFVLRPTATPGTLGKKVYCTYFLNTGNCNYMQEGCKYKHEFPNDEGTRTAIGLRKLPTWMRDDPAVPIKPIPSLSGQTVPTAFQQNWRSRAQSQPPQADLGGAPKAPVSTFSPVRGRTSTITPNAATTHGPPMQPQNSNSNNHAQQGQFFGPPGHHFPSHANHNVQQQSRSLSGAFSNGNGHGHNSPAMISADSFNRQIPTNGTIGSYNQPAATVGRPASNVKASSADIRVNGQHQANGNTYNHDRSHQSRAAPDARIRNSAVYTPSRTTASSQDDTTGSATPLAHVNDNVPATSNHQAQGHNHFAGLHSIGNTAIPGSGTTAAALDFRASTPASNGPQPLMSNDLHQLSLNTQPLTPTALSNNHQGTSHIVDNNDNVYDNNNSGSAGQSNASQTDPGSPAYVHPRMFVQEGEPRFVTNAAKGAHSSSKDVHKKGTKKAPSSSGGKRGHKGRGTTHYSETLI